MNFKLNGVEKSFAGDPNLSLLKYLREHEYLISPKDGCSPQAACGACTIELNGKAVLSCVTPMSKVEDGEIFTTEGIEKRIKDALVTAFAKHGAVQCGFCTPGMILNACSLLLKNPEPSESEIIQQMDDNLCRCGSYNRIIQAIQSASRKMKGAN